MLPFSYRLCLLPSFFFFSSRRRHPRCLSDWSSDVCSSDLAFRENLAASVPIFVDRVAELKDWDQIKLLTVAVDRMPRWHRPGLLCIGDAAHAMSPIGGVGVRSEERRVGKKGRSRWSPYPLK